MRRRYTFLLLLIVFAASCKQENLVPAEITGKRINIDGGIAPDTSIANFIKPYADHVNSNLDSIIAYNPTDLNKNDGELNTALGNMMADLIMEQVNPIFKSRTGKDIDIVLLNQGGIRSSIGKGPVTERTAYSLMPFENEVVIVELKGEKILEMLDYLENNKTAHPLSGIRILMDENYKITDATIKGEQIDPEKNYFVATSDYLQKGGDNMVFLSDPINLFGADYKIRNAIIDYFYKVDTLKTKRDERYTKISN